MSQVEVRGWPDDLPRFTEEELFGVFVLFMPEREARAEARDLAAPDEETPSEALALLPPVSSGKAREDRKWRPVRDVSLSDDTLILLSLMSPGLEKKVESYRAVLSQDEQQAWDERRSLLRKWLEAGHPLDEES